MLPARLCGFKGPPDTTRPAGRTVPGFSMKGGKGTGSALQSLRLVVVSSRPPPAQSSRSRPCGSGEMERGAKSGWRRQAHAVDLRADLAEYADIVIRQGGQACQFERENDAGEAALPVHPWVGAESPGAADFLHRSIRRRAGPESTSPSRSPAGSDRGKTGKAATGYGIRSGPASGS